MKVILLTLVLLLSLPAGMKATLFRFVFVDEATITEMQPALEAAALRLEKLLETRLPDTVTVVIVETKAEFDSVAGGLLPEWGAAVAISPRNLMVLRAPLMNNYPGNTTNLLQHELAHIALYHRTGGVRIPRFLDEGFACWFAGQWYFANVTTVAKAQLTKSLFPLRRIDRVNAFHQAEARLAYSQSYLVVFYIYDHFGELAWLELLDALTAGQNLDEACRSAFNIPFWQFEADYRRFLSDNYTIFAILSDSMGLWIVLAIVVIAGYIIIKRRKKNAIERWKEEEKLESTDFDYDESSPWD
ncbi:MAG: hypothetical protein KAT58_02245 [candidate division Zixibacteria bacterium]|nr:hypothetical protein [candidate division Zixibacteria bacterium]